MKTKKRILAILLSACLIAGMIPIGGITAFAAGTDTGKAIQLVDSGTAANISGGQADSVWFGTYKQSSDGNNGYNTDPIKWRVLENANGKLFLLSDQNLDVFEYHKEYESVTWETSTMRSWLNGLAANQGSGDNAIDYAGNNFLDNAFSAKEQTAIADTEVVNDNNPDYQTEGGNNTTDKIFLLSIAEARNNAYFADDNSRIATNTAYVAGGGEIRTSGMNGVDAADYWWLRSPGRTDDYAAGVYYYGGVDSNGYGVDDVYDAVRPAFNLNLNSVLFTSAAEGGKISVATGDGNQGGEAADAIFEIPTTTTSEWKLTLLDADRNFSVTETEAIGKPGETITLHYSGATTGTNEYISVIIEGNSGATHYGRITQPADESGTVEIKIPSGLADGTYTLNVFSEQYNGGEQDDTKLTDYASAFEVVKLAIDSTSVATASLTVSNTVNSDKPEDAEKEFSFTVTLSSDAVNGVYGDMTFVNGVAAITLKSGESKTATGLPEGMRYVVEADTPEGYRIDSRNNETGTLSNSCTASFIFVPRVTKPDITTTSLPDGTVGTAYSQILAATGDTPITWSIAEGSLPDGLTLSGDTISGTPTTVGNFTFTIKATNSAGEAAKELAITIEAAPHTHSWTGAWSKDDAYHWRECTNSGCDVTENSSKGSYGVHTWDDACDTSCNTCGYTRSTSHSFDNTCDTTCNENCGYTRSITHSYGAEWSKDASGHWHECSVCGDKKDLASHVPGAEATEDTPQVCTECGYVIKAALGHTHNYGTSLTYDSTGHWYACTCSEKKDFAVHSFDDACDTDCNENCGYTRTITHSPKSEWSQNGDGHWHDCSVCGEDIGYAVHTPGAEATENNPQTCTECGYVIEAALGHTHNYGTSLTYDSTGHWYACTCSEKKDFAVHSFDDACDTDCNENCGYTRTITHSPKSEWSQNGDGHWHDCSVCGEDIGYAVHTPGEAATENNPQTCTECGYELAPVLGHTHSYGTWASNGNGTHTRTCSKDNSHKETTNCSGGTATCKDKATCTVCGQPYGNTSSTHTGGVEVRNKKEPTTTQAGYTGDIYCLGCGTKTKTGTTIPKLDDDGSGGHTSPPADDNDDDSGYDTPADPEQSESAAPTVPTNQPTTGESGGWKDIGDEISNTPPGGTVHVDMNGTTDVPAKIWREIAGKDIVVEFEMGDGISWTVNGQDIPTGGSLSDLNLGISTTANTIPVEIINNITGERYTMQLTLSHNGEFGFRLYLNVEVGLESAGHWANLYYYNLAGNALEFMAAARIDSAGKAALPFDHASSYAVVIDTENHTPKDNPGTGGEEIPTSPDTGDDTPTYVTYTVQKGDTLWAIAKKYGCTVSDIVAANSDLIKDADLIHIGWQLQIPQGGAIVAGSTTDAILPDDKKTGVYIVRHGDTLWAISKRYGCTVAEIVALNGELITDPDLIFAGWELKMPQG